MIGRRHRSGHASSRQEATGGTALWQLRPSRCHASSRRPGSQGHACYRPVRQAVLSSEGTHDDAGCLGEIPERDAKTIGNRAALGVFRAIPNDPRLAVSALSTHDRRSGTRWRDWNGEAVYPMERRHGAGRQAARAGRQRYRWRKAVADNCNAPVQPVAQLHRRRAIRLLHDRYLNGRALMPSSPGTPRVRTHCRRHGSPVATRNRTRRPTTCHLSPCRCTATRAAPVGERRVVPRTPCSRPRRPRVPSRAAAWSALGAGRGPGGPVFAELRSGSGSATGQRMRAPDLCLLAVTRFGPMRLPITASYRGWPRIRTAHDNMRLRNESGRATAHDERVATESAVPAVRPLAGGER